MAHDEVTDPETDDSAKAEHLGVACPKEVSLIGHPAARTFPGRATALPGLLVLARLLLCVL